MRGRWGRVAAIAMLGLAQGAQAAETPATDCEAALFDANVRIAAIKARDPQIDALVKKKDIKGACAILRLNVTDMTSARDSMNACLTGFDHNEEVAELNANLADLNDAIAAHCA
ncbi:MAG TPA: hypothetical protein VMU08_07290 [Rhizomicrobium sp.]|nr:hypothetical protein [Rhizomicrobium sp.]